MEGVIGNVRKFYNALERHCVHLFVVVVLYDCSMCNCVSHTSVAFDSCFSECMTGLFVSKNSLCALSNVLLVNFMNEYNVRCTLL